MATQTLQQNVVGTRITVVFKDSAGNAVDISGADTLQIWVKPPDGGTLLTKTATLTGDGTDGSCYFETEAGDLSAAGDYKLQGYRVEGTDVLYTRVGVFEVEPNLS